MKLSVIILTMGDRPVELARAVRSALALGEVEVVIVSNGSVLNPTPHGSSGRGSATTIAPSSDAVEEFGTDVIDVRLPENVGIPAGRNRGVEASTGDILAFLDDDGWYESEALGDHLREEFAKDPKLGIVSFRVRDPEGGAGERRHVPRLRAGDPGRSSEVTTFLGGACAIRRAVFDEVGGLPDEFFYAHEETDLAWRALNAGYRIVYDADAVMFHPAVAPSRHDMFYRLNARNRVWLARRNLPWPLAFCYLGVWTAMTVLRERKPAALRPWFKGFREGWRSPAGARRPMSWRTVWRMTRLGRPPLI